MIAYTETRTQEDIIEMDTADGLGCKACGAALVLGEVVASEGDIYCWTCGVELESVGATVVVLPTRAQAAGIGAN